MYRKRSSTSLHRKWSGFWTYLKFLKWFYKGRFVLFISIIFCSFILLFYSAFAKPYAV